jgi:hypothetical protein
MVLKYGPNTDAAKAEWSEGTPHKLEAKVLSVVCGNTHLHWAVHNGVKDSFAPILFWR